MATVFNNIANQYINDVTNQVVSSATATYGQWAQQNIPVGIASLQGIVGPSTNVGTVGNATQQNAGVSSIRQTGVLRTNLFGTYIEIPRSLKQGSTPIHYDARDIQLYAESVNLPGVNIGTTQTRRYGYGPVQKVANDVTFNDVVVNFIGDGNGVISSFFSSWMNSIVPYDYNVSSGEQYRPYFFEYKRNYVSPRFEITVFDEGRAGITRNKVLVYTLEDAFPTAVSDINLSWGDNDQLARFMVTFAYTSWKVQTFAQSLQQNKADAADAARSSAATDNLTMIFSQTTAQTFSSLGLPVSVSDVTNVVQNAKLMFS